MKELNTQHLWTSDFYTQEGVNLPIWITVGFQQRDGRDSQNLNKDTFYRPSITNAQCIISTEKYPDSVFLNYDDDDYSQGYGQNKQAFKALTKGDILKPFISDHDFRATNVGNDNGYNL